MKRIAFAVGMVLAACSPQAQDRAVAAASAGETTVHPVSGLEVIPLTISQNGKVHHFRVEVASTDEEQQRGLMFREKMGPDEGMIFPHDPPRMASFWMKNTVLPLDIVFIGTDHRITNVSANATPYSLDPRMSDGLTVAVLELNGGRLAALGFTPGALVEW
jgi:uncharacterized membrane protein (UPF0127 family)